MNMAGVIEYLSQAVPVSAWGLQKDVLSCVTGISFNRRLEYKTYKHILVKYEMNSPLQTPRIEKCNELLVQLNNCQ